ncbi:MAG: hypothetical protein CM1200mP4_0920 [Rhodospirillaceae bacterium]|nr:MAG: hypothetical protein CM1200mP4_0920 [Rhodospirillaceae bacterium]
MLAEGSAPWEPGITSKQPFSSEDSSIAIQTEHVAKGALFGQYSPPDAMAWVFHR